MFDMSTAVRVVVLSDTHGQHRNVSVPDGDLLIHCGDWTKSTIAVNVRLCRIRQTLNSCLPRQWPVQNIDPARWGLFVMDVQGTKSSVYMMKFGAYIPLSGMPHRHDPRTFPTLKKWQQAAALEVVYEYVKEGKVMGPLPGHTRHCPVSGLPLVFYPSFVVP